jgi:hypothetical protein
MAFCLGAAFTASGGEQLPTTVVGSCNNNNNNNNNIRVNAGTSDMGTITVVTE